MGYRVRVKICGITREEDLFAAFDAGADAVGFNFHPGSPRFLSIDRARQLLRQVPPMVEPIGVHVKQTIAQLQPLIAALGGLRAMQVHGCSPECTDAFPLAYIPAFQVRERKDLEEIQSYLARCAASNCLPAAVLIDGYAQGQAGGTGVNAPWHLLENFRPGVPLILAGGLRPENVARAIQQVRPFAVDVASGVESAPGIKDPTQLRRFIEAVYEAAGKL